MLSRVAEQVYWFGRHVERAENTARLAGVNANLLMDLPRSFLRLWANAIDIMGSRDAFYARYDEADEKNVLLFILADEGNPASLLNTVRMARENARSSREIIPIEAWEKINEFYLYTRKHKTAGLKRSGRHKFLGDIIGFCHHITGLLSSDMSHGESYGFVLAGRNLERADLSTRIIDAGYLNLLPDEDDAAVAFDDLLWLNVLNSLSSYQVYRQHVKVRPNGEDVVNFLLRNDNAPRSVSHCLEAIHGGLARLPYNSLPLKSVQRTQELLETAEAARLMQKDGLHALMDQIQLNLVDIHQQVEQTWFRH